MIINKKEYDVDKNDFPEYTIPDYPKLRLLKNLDFCEILIGLVSDICEMGNYNFIYDETKYKNFIISNVRNNDNTSNINIVYSNNTNMITHQNQIIISKNRLTGAHIYYIPTIEHYITISNELHNIFIDNFKYYIEGSNLNYNNLINLVMIVKDAGEQFYTMLKENINVFDRYTILDTGSTDNTIDMIKKVYMNKKGIIIQEPFINFRESRNRSLELAGHYCKYNLILDDSYIVKGDLRSFLTKVRNDQLSDSFSIYIKSDDMLYCSNRIIKSETNLRYI